MLKLAAQVGGRVSTVVLVCDTCLRETSVLNMDGLKAKIEALGWQMEVNPERITVICHVCRYNVEVLSRTVP